MLTCHSAYVEALKYQDVALTPYWLEHISYFTPTIKVDSNWSCVFMNAMFCEAMYRRNPLKAMCFMDEAGVPYDAIKDLAHQFKTLPQVDTYVDIAPPTFLDTPSKWLKRGYEVLLKDAKHGDLVVTNDLVGCYQGADGESIKVLAFDFKSRVATISVARDEQYRILRV